MSSDLEYDIDDGGDFADNADEEEEDLQEADDDGQFDEEEDQQQQQHQQGNFDSAEEGGSIDEEEYEAEDDATQGHGNIKQEMMDDNDEQIQSSNVSENAGDYDEEGEDVKPAGGDEQQMDGEPIIREEDLDENGVYKWKEFQGAVVS